MKGLSLEQSKLLYREVLRDDDTETLRRLCREDLFFLLYCACRRWDLDHPWLYDRCREVEDEPYGCLDLWARSHYKSTILTFGQTLQSILRDPEITICFFSHTRPIAKAFLNQTKTELENNDFLKRLFPEILWDNPQREAPTWSLDLGLLVKRRGNPKEKTIEAWGLVDGQPTSKHFKVLKYDDIVTLESVTNPEMIAKTTNAYQMSANLGDLVGGYVRQIVGTRYAHGDTYRNIIDNQTAKIRKHPCTHDGTEGGKPVLLTREQLNGLRKEMGPYVFAAQMLLDPASDRAMGFKKEWFQTCNMRVGAGWNIYLICDPASKRKKTSDFTVFVVVALAPDGNMYLLDGIRDRMNLTARTNHLLRLHRKWLPTKTGYEEYGMQADIEHIQTVQERENYRFRIQPLGGSMAKEDRIRRLVPPFEQFKVWFPFQLPYRDWEGRTRDFVHEFLFDEFITFPVSLHDDMMDCLSRIKDPDFGAVFPTACNPSELGYDGRQKFSSGSTTNSEYEVL